MLLLLLSLLFAASVLVIGSVLQSADFQTAAGGTVVTSAETICVTGVMCAVETPTCKVAVKGWCLLTPGTGTTAVTLRIYRGTTIGGTVIGTATAQAGGFTVGNSTYFVAVASDLLTNAGGAQYSLSVQQTGASGNGTVVNCAIETTVLSG